MSFALDISSFQNKVNLRMDTVLRKVALDLHADIVLRTPVDTGRARANWNAGVNDVDDSVSNEADKAATYTIERAARVIEKIKSGDAVYLTNNLDYIQYLEEGSSRQAPSGMVALALQNYPQIVDRSAREARRKIP